MLLKSELLNIQGYDQFGISRKGSEDVADQCCTIFYDKEKVINTHSTKKTLNL